MARGASETLLVACTTLYAVRFVAIGWTQGRQPIAVLFQVTGAVGAATLEPFRGGDDGAASTALVIAVGACGIGPELASLPTARILGALFWSAAVTLLALFSDAVPADSAVDHPGLFRPLEAEGAVEPEVCADFLAGAGGEFGRVHFRRGVHDVHGVAAAAMRRVHDIPQIGIQRLVPLPLPTTAGAALPTSARGIALAVIVAIMAGAQDMSRFVDDDFGEVEGVCGADRGAGDPVPPLRSTGPAHAHHSDPAEADHAARVTRRQ